MIIRGAMATCEHQQESCSEGDVLVLGSALSELHVLRRQWNGALDVRIDVNDVLQSTPEMKTSPGALNVSRFSFVAEAALVRCFLCQRLHYSFKSSTRYCFRAKGLNCSNRNQPLHDPYLTRTEQH